VLLVEAAARALFVVDGTTRDVWLEPKGEIFVSDDGLNAIFEVDPATGDRAIVSGPDRTADCPRPDDP
jgi:streptogramin lyase